MENFKFHRLANIMLGQLAAREQAAVRRRLESLADMPPEDWPKRLVKRSAKDPSVYMLRVDPSLRAVLRVTEGKPVEVLDLIRQEALDYFSESKA